MTQDLRFDRRQLWWAAAGLTGAAVALPREQPRITPALDLHDPRIALRSYLKLRGSIADATVFQPYEGDIFRVSDGEVSTPLCGFIGLQKSVWRRAGPDAHTNEDYDVGFYVDYQSRQILDHWRNPLTGKTVEVYHYRGGPSGARHSLDSASGDVYGGRAGRWALMGEQLSHTVSNWSERPNPLDPKDWPHASSGERLQGSMSLSFAARVADIADPATHQVPAVQIWTNTTSWMPWMEMGQRPGFNVWRWIGAKGTARDRLDPTLVAAVERAVPGYVWRDATWKIPTSGRLDYQRQKQGLELTR